MTEEQKKICDDNCWKESSGEYPSLRKFYYLSVLRFLFNNGIPHKDVGVEQFGKGKVRVIEFSTDGFNGRITFIRSNKIDISGKGINLKKFCGIYKSFEELMIKLNKI